MQSSAQPSLSLPSARLSLFVSRRRAVLSLLYSRVHAYSLSFPVSLLAIFRASTGWHVRRRILRNSMEIARVPETALERISRHRVSQRRTPRLDIPIRYTAGTWGAHCETHRNRGRDRARANDRAQRKKEKERFLRWVTRFRPVIGNVQARCPHVYSAASYWTILRHI